MSRKAWRNTFLFSTLNPKPLQTILDYYKATVYFMFPTAQTMAHCKPTQMLTRAFKTTSTDCHLSESVLLERSAPSEQIRGMFLPPYKITVVQKRRKKPHQLYRDPYSQSSLMWQYDPDSSPDQSFPNLSPKSRRDMIEETNISP